MKVKNINDGLSFWIKHDMLTCPISGRSPMGYDNLIPREDSIMESSDGYFSAQRNDDSLWIGKGTENLFDTSIGFSDMTYIEYLGDSTYKLRGTGSATNTHYYTLLNNGWCGLSNIMFTYEIVEINITSGVHFRTASLIPVTYISESMDEGTIISENYIGTSEDITSMGFAQPAGGSVDDYIVFKIYQIEDSSYATPMVQNSRKDSILIYEGFTDWRNTSFVLKGINVSCNQQYKYITTNITNTTGGYFSMRFEDANYIDKNYILILKFNDTGLLYGEVLWEDGSITEAGIYNDFNNYNPDYNGLLNFTHMCTIDGLKECKVWDRQLSTDEINQLKKEFLDDTPKPYIDIDFTKGISDPVNEVYPLGYDNLIPRADGVIESSDGNLVCQRTDEGLWIGKGAENLIIIDSSTPCHIVTPDNGYDRSIYYYNSSSHASVYESEDKDYNLYFKIKKKGKYAFSTMVIGGSSEYDAWYLRAGISEDNILSSNHTDCWIINDQSCVLCTDEYLLFSINFTVKGNGTSYLSPYILFIAETVDVDSFIKDISLVEDISYITPFVKNNRNDGKYIIPNFTDFRNKTFVIEHKTDSDNINKIILKILNTPEQAAHYTVNISDNNNYGRTVVSFDDTNQVYGKTLYDDGEINTSVLTNNFNINSTNTLYIGGNPELPHHLNYIKKFQVYDECLSTAQCENLLNYGTLENQSDNTSLEDSCVFYIADGEVTDRVNGLTPVGYDTIIPKDIGYVDNEDATCNFQVVEEETTEELISENLTDGYFDESGTVDSTWKRLEFATIQLDVGEQIIWKYNLDIVDSSGMNMGLLTIKSDDDVYSSNMQDIFTTPKNELIFTNTTNEVLYLDCNIYLTDDTPTGGTYHIRGMNDIRKISYPSKIRKALWLGKSTENIYNRVNAQGINISDFTVEEFDGYSRVTRIANTGTDCNMFCIEDINIGNGQPIPNSLENNTEYSYNIKIDTSSSFTGSPRITRIDQYWSQKDIQIITSGYKTYKGSFTSGVDDKYLGIRCNDMAIGEWINVYHDIVLEQSSFSTPYVEKERRNDSYLEYNNMPFNDEMTINFTYKTPYKESDIISQQTTLKLLQLGGYYQNSSMTLWFWDNRSFLINSKSDTSSSWDISSYDNSIITLDTFNNIHNITILYSKSNSKFNIYIDGELVIESATTDTYNTLFSNILRLDNLGETYKGNVNSKYYNLSIFNRVLTYDEIQELHERNGYLNIESKGEYMPVPYSIPARDDYGTVRNSFVVKDATTYPLPLWGGYIAKTVFQTGELLLVDLDSCIGSLTLTDSILTYEQLLEKYPTCTELAEAINTCDELTEPIDINIDVLGNYWRATSNDVDVPYSVKYYKK